MNDHDNAAGNARRLLQHAVTVAVILVAVGATRLAAKDVRIDFLTSNLGKFCNEVSDLNHIHLHPLPESEYPLVYGRFFVEQNLKGVGLSLYDALLLSIGGGGDPILGEGKAATSGGRI